MKQQTKIRTKKSTEPFVVKEPIEPTTKGYMLGVSMISHNASEARVATVNTSYMRVTVLETMGRKIVRTHQVTLSRKEAANWSDVTDRDLLQMCIKKIESNKV